jgi:hypothetical protein
MEECFGEPRQRIAAAEHPSSEAARGYWQSALRFSVTRRLWWSLTLSLRLRTADAEYELLGQGQARQA